jgi:hypothetical protein
MVVSFEKHYGATRSGPTGALEAERAPANRNADVAPLCCQKPATMGVGSCEPLLTHLRSLDSVSPCGGKPAAVGEMVDYWFGDGSFAQMHSSVRKFLIAGAARNGLDVGARHTHTEVNSGADY